MYITYSVIRVWKIVQVRSYGGHRNRVEVVDENPADVLAWP